MLKGELGGLVHSHLIFAWTERHVLETRSRKDMMLEVRVQLFKTVTKWMN